MKLNKFKILICISVVMSFNSSLASITVVKKQRASVEEEASKPIDDSYISSLDEDSLFEKVTGSYDDELDFINDLDPETVADKKESDSSKRKITSSIEDDLNNLLQN